jgi:hypothetical protein
MVGPIKYRKTDPNGNGRGAGYYYHRGDGYYSKYGTSADNSKRNVKTKLKKARYGYRHTGDGTYKSKKHKKKAKVASRRRYI